MWDKNYNFYYYYYFIIFFGKRVGWQEFKKMLVTFPSAFFNKTRGGACIMISLNKARRTKKKGCGGGGVQGLCLSLFACLVIVFLFVVFWVCVSPKFSSALIDAAPRHHFQIPFLRALRSQILPPLLDRDARPNSAASFMLSVSRIQSWQFPEGLRDVRSWLSL